VELIAPALKGWLGVPSIISLRYKQWQKLGAQVRQGERGSVIVFYKEFERANSGGEDEERPRFVARATRVFNAEQVDGWEYPASKVKSEVEINEQLEAFTRATKANILHGSHRACYSRQTDRIEVPNPEQFVGTPTSSPTEAYYAVLLHELTHNAVIRFMPRAIENVRLAA